jgi:hypothetical protein
MNYSKKITLHLLTLITATGVNSTHAVATTYMGDPGSAPVSVNTPCGNNDAYSQFPDNVNMFVGRLDNAYYNNCTNTNSVFSLAVYQMNWTTNTLSVVNEILPAASTLSDGYTPTQSYDPYIAQFNGEYWVTWECHDFTGSDFGGTCVGPLTLNSSGQYKIDTSRSILAVDTGTDPKFLTVNGKIFLYWTEIFSGKGPCTQYTYLKLTTQGVELSLHSSGGKTFLWPSPNSARIEESNSNIVTVKQVGSDSMSNLTADVYSTQAINGEIYTIAGVGGNADNYSCVTPGPSQSSPSCNSPAPPESAGCYRAQVSMTNNPLGTNAFSADIYSGEFSDPSLTLDSQEYVRFAVNPNGNLFMMGNFLGEPTDITGIPVPTNSFFPAQPGVSNTTLSSACNSTAPVCLATLGAQMVNGPAIPAPTSGGGSSSSGSSGGGGCSAGRRKPASGEASVADGLNFVFLLAGAYGVSRRLKRKK